jgi:hypothetical protein
MVSSFREEVVVLSFQVRRPVVAGPVFTGLVVTGFVVIGLVVTGLVVTGPALAAPASLSPSSAAPLEVPGPEEALEPCGTFVTPVEAAAYLKHREELAGRTPRGGSGPPYYVAIAPHIVRHSDGTGGLPVERYEQAVADANGHYAARGIVFYTVDAGVDFIDSDDYYTTTTLTEINDLRSENPVPDAINIYFTENLDYESGGLCGISAFTFSSVQAIAMRNSCTANPAGLGNHSTFSHEVGHYFNLFHTHEPAYGDEFVDGSNCGTAGDLLCDTPADPRLTSGTVDSGTCEYTGSQVDGHGDPYEPDATLLMSYSLKHCRSYFSAESLVRIEETLVAERPELISNAVSAPAPADADAGFAVSLAAPRPNPSAGVSQLRFTLDAPSRAELTIYDVRGARVRTVARSLYGAGEHVAGWDGLDASGRSVAPGIYFARLTAGGHDAVQKIQRVR